MSKTVDSTANVVEIPSGGGVLDAKDAAAVKSSQEANSFVVDNSFSTGNFTAQETVDEKFGESGDFGPDFEKLGKGGGGKGKPYDGQTPEGGKLDGLNKKLEGLAETEDHDNTNDNKKTEGSGEKEKDNTNKDTLKKRESDDNPGEGLGKDSEDTEGGEGGEAKQIPTDKPSGGKAKGEAGKSELDVPPLWV